MINDVKVIVCGKEYKLKTSESPNYVFALARALEAKINGTLNSKSGSSPYDAAIMVALSLADDLNKANQHLDNIRNQTKEYVDEAGKSRIELESALKEIEVLKSKNAQLENAIKLKQLGDKL
ncbi:MAG: cell division protein ZapA [Ruminococcus sp.]|nr:cell division protein ZapA [Ruminococcus sp.]